MGSGKGALTLKCVFQLFCQNNAVSAHFSAGLRSAIGRAPDS